jgi:hypothetical protein
MRVQFLRRNRVLLFTALVTTAIWLTSSSLSAHHGWGGYVDALSDLSGTVDTPVSLAGPHATMKVNADGHVWDVVLAPPARTEAAGLKEGMIPVGAKFIVHGQKHRDSKKFEIKTTRLTWNGRVFKIYDDRN